MSRDLWGYGWRVAASFRIVNEDDDWVAYHGDKPVGSLSVDYTTHTPSIDSVRVHPDYQRQGIARSLWEAAGRPAHTDDDMSEAGRAWARSVGGDRIGTASRTAMPTWYHLTDDPDFQLDPDREPANYNNIRQFGRGVFLTQRPDEWAYTEEDGGWSGDRPYVAEIDAPENMHERLLDVWHDPHSVRPDDPYPGSDETFVPYHQFRKLRVKNVRPRKARTMTAAVTVYTRPSCIQCTMTKKQLDKLGIEHDTVDVTQDPDAHAYVTGLGYTSAPVVVVGDGEDHWAGFKPDRLRGLVE